MSQKILLADDSVTAQNMGKKILSDAGYEVITVSNGSAALKKILELKPDIAVLDVYMPGHSGLEVCKLLKANPETVNIPVLLTVGKLEPFKSDEALKAKANAFIIKPFEASELLAIIRKIEEANSKPAAKAKASKGSRLAQAFAANAVAETPDPDAEIEVAGWKNRISMPATKKAEAEPLEDYSTVGTGFRDIAPVRSEASGLRRDSSFTADAPGETSAMERPKGEPAAAEHPLKAVGKESVAAKPEAAPPTTETSTVELPLDITPDEIAAIKAAVEVLSGEGNKAPVLHLAAAALEGIAPSHRELAPEPEYSSEVLADPQALTRSTNIPETEYSKNEAEPVAESAPTPAAAVKEASAAPAAAQEVVPDEVPEQVVTAPPVTRWRAEVAELTVAEASASLELEMQLAVRENAAEIAAHTHNLAEFVQTDIASPVDNEPVLSDVPGFVVPAAEAESETLAVAAAASSASNGVSSPATGEDRTPAEKPFTQNFAAVASLAPAFTPEIAHSAAMAPEAQASTGFQDLRPQTWNPPDRTGDTAATTAVEAHSFEQTTPVVEAKLASSADHSAPEDEIDSRTNAQMDAAWSNWHDIRNTIVKPSLTDQIQEVAEASAKADATVQVAAEAAGQDTSDIANIVDTMLAEMRPKLLEEIARKLAANKKE